MPSKYQITTILDQGKEGYFFEATISRNWQLTLLFTERKNIFCVVYILSVIALNYSYGQVFHKYKIVETLKV